MKKAKFKMTEIGPIPEDWDVKRLGEVCENIRNGYNYDFREHGRYPMSRIETISSGEINYKRVALIEHEPPSEYKLKVGDILYSHINSLPYIGNIAQYDGADCLYHGMNLLLLRPNDAIDYMYLKYLLKSETMRSKARSAAKVAINQASISTRDLSEFQVAYPPLHEQKKIAVALSDVDELLTAMTTLIEKKRAIKQGAMQELLTGKKRLPGFGGKWIEKRLGDCALIKARIGWQGLTTDEYLENGPYYLITGSDFRDGKVNWSQCYYVDKSRYEQDKNIQIQKNDVLVSKDGTIGKVAFLDEIPGEGTLNSGVFVIRTRDKEIEQLYMAWVFLSKWFDDFINRLVAGSTIVHLYQKDIVGFEFPVPPTIAEQKAIAEVLSDMDAEIEALEAKRAKYESIKQSMMQELLTGRMRMKD